jgi:hypothetical protein
MFALESCKKNEVLKEQTLSSAFPDLRLDRRDPGDATLSRPWSRRCL